VDSIIEVNTLMKTRWQYEFEEMFSIIENKSIKSFPPLKLACLPLLLSLATALGSSVQIDELYSA